MLERLSKTLAKNELAGDALLAQLLSIHLKRRGKDIPFSDVGIKEITLGQKVPWICVDGYNSSVWSKDPLTGEFMYKHEKFSFWPEKHIVKKASGEEKILSPKPSSLLRELVNRVNRVQSKDELFKNVWGGREHFPLEILSAQIGHLRKAIESNPSKPEIILLELGRGYWLKDTRQENYKSMSQIDQGLSYVDPEEVISYPGLDYYPERHLVIIDGKRKTQLTPTENKVFKLLSRNPGRVITMFYLERIWEDKDVDDMASLVRSYIYSLRRKIGRDWIVNVRGGGYFFVVPQRLRVVE